MRIPSWAFAFLRLGILGLIYVHFGPRYDDLFGQPLLYYGLPMLMLMAALGIHRYWMFALGTLLLCTSIAQLAPAIFGMNRFRYFMIGMVAFFLGFTPCDRDYSVRAWWNKESPEFFDFKAEPGLTWNLYRLMVCFLYLRYLLTKTNAETFEGMYVARGLSWNYWGSDFLFAPWFGPACIGVAVLLYVLNIGLAAAVWFPRSYRLFVPAAVTFHLVHLSIQGFHDMTHYLFLLLLIPFGSVQRLDKPLTIHQGIPVSF